MKNPRRMTPILFWVAVILALGSLVTLLPVAGKTKPNLLGYSSLCSFAPVSTLIMLFAANTCNGIRKKMLVK